MSLLRGLIEALRSLSQRRRVGEELEEELIGFVEMAVEEKMKLGMSREEAARAVRLERGNLEVTKEVVRAASLESLIETSWQDLRYGARIHALQGNTQRSTHVCLGFDWPIWRVLHGKLHSRAPRDSSRPYGRAALRVVTPSVCS
jgi:hypothetical protein